MIGIVQFSKRFVMKAFHRPVHMLGRLLRPPVFQTTVGVKYHFIRFDSNRFSEYVIQTIPFVTADISFSDLVMPPDLLQNRYTLCGQSVTRSPHYRLIEEICMGVLTLDSEYIMRSKTGTLDARLPTNPTLEFLIHKCQTRQAEMFSGKTMTIFVTKVTLRDKLAYVIADGKHRAALAAYHNKPESLLMQVISKEFVRDRFFSKVYSHTLNMDPAEYSINQEMIKMLKDMSK